MKNTLLSLAVLLGFSLSSIAQPVMSIGDVTVLNGTSGCVPVTIGSNAPLGIPNILSITNVMFSWDPVALTNVTIENLNPLMLGLVPGDFTFALMDQDTAVMDWVFLECNLANNNAAGVDFPNVDQALHAFDICFETANGGYGECLPIEIVNPPNNPPIVHRSFTFQEPMGCPNIGLIYSPACVYIDVSPLEIMASSTTGNTGDFVCVDFSVNGFTGLTSTQFEILWDPTVLAPRPACSGGIIPGDNIENLSCGSFNTSFAPDFNKLRVAWFAVPTDPPHGVTLQDSSIFFTACFDIIGDCETATLFSIGGNVEIGNVIMAETEIAHIFTPGGVTVNDCDPIGLQLFADCGAPVNINDEICIPVTVGDNFQAITAMHFLMEWNESILTFNRVENENGTVINLAGSINTANVGNGILQVEWDFPPPANLNNGDGLFDVCFDVTGLGGNSPISFVSSPSEVIQSNNGVNIGINPSNCEVIVNQPDQVAMTMGSGTSGVGEEFCVEVEVTSNFEQITGYQFSLEWDFQLFQYQSSTILNFPPTALINDAAAVSVGLLGFDWEDVTPLDITNGTSILEVCFIPLGNPGECSPFTLSPIPSPSEAISANQNGEDIGIVETIGELCTLFPEGFGITIDTLTGSWLDTACVSISVESFDNITDASFCINWDPASLRFVDLNNFGTWPGLGAALALNGNAGIVCIDWSDPTAPPIPDDTDVFELCFELIGEPRNCYPVTVSETPAPPTVSTTNGQGSLLFTNGEICIQDRFFITDTIITSVSCPGEEDGEIMITVTGGEGTIFTSWTQNGNQQFGQFFADHLVAGDTVFLNISDSGNPILTESHFFIIPLDTMNLPTADAGEDVRINCNTNLALLDGIASEGDSFEWQDLVSGNSSPQNPFFAGGAGQYSFCVTNATSGCIVCDTVTVFLPILPIAEAGDSVAISCLQDTVMLNGTGSEVGDTISYTWTFLSGVGGIVPGDENILTPSVTEPGFYELEVTNTILVCSSVDTVKVVDNRDFPEAIINNGNQTETIACEDNVILNANTTNNSAVVVYDWFDLGETPLFTGANFAVSTLGSYVMVASDTITGCVASDTIQVLPNEDFPIIITSPEMDSSLTCLVDSIQIIATIENINPGFTFTWTALAGGQFVPPTETTLSPIIVAAGIYQLEVTDTLTNCVALAEITIADETTLPIADAGSDLELTCVVMSDTLVGINTTVGDGIIYTWTNENGDIISTDIFAVVDTEGTYCLEVSNSNTGCSAIDCVDVTANRILPVITSDNFSQSLSCAIDTLILTPVTISTDNEGYTTLWTGPSFLGDETSDTITVIQSGVYHIAITDTISGCIGGADFIIGLDTISPIALAGVDTVFNCITSVLTLGEDGTSDGAEFSYVWTNIVDGEVPAPNDTKTIDITIPGTYELEVTSSTNGCMSSDIIVVGEDFALPEISIEIPEEITCITTCVDLTGSVVGLTDFTVEWTTIDGGMITPIDELITTVCDTGSYILTLTNNINGCTSADTVLVSGDITEPAIVFDMVDPFTCLVESIQIDASQSGTLADFSIIEWTTTIGDGTVTPATGTLIIDVDGPGTYELHLVNAINGCEATATIEVESQMDLPTANAGDDAEIECGQAGMLDGTDSSMGAEFSYQWTSIEGILTGDLMSLTPSTEGAGIYELSVTNTDNGCVSSDTVMINLILPDDAQTMPDVMLCGDSLALSANLPAETTGMWTTSSTSIIADANQNNTTVTQLGAGDNLFIWTLSADGCTDYSADTLTVSSEVAPIANNDLLELTEEIRNGTINLLANDITNGSSVTLTIVTGPTFGQIDTLLNGVLSYSVGPGASGETTVVYQICNDNCPDACDEATLIITVPVDPTEPEVANTITPNGDGLNDVFIFDILANNAPEEFPDNEIIIFNRWGDIIYEAKPYNNDWDGKNSAGLDLPQATYYYILRLNISKGEIIRGDITIIK